ncbi:preprotein translocase subunit SecY [candidate division TA06 bacterium DG_24]|uniref:Protein translocase subunit SecY n=3 Tax=Bacteria division TA06 TaxID=1156500 RepID=A0A0S8JJL6_UNCT6|nr:MAG: preprotein translocase subunit SecY [candidate division TA06 bacterium DG_24]KPK70895.1 MAG: preprotein translocase subunit SecY [candidate division TA06 bacterium SM23_40]KPL09570.1 MAG: preprotein translocase subunit SecY [candidate division TA06 bacterium SM1_40]
MIQTFQNIFKIPELRRRILFTLALLIVYRLGAHVPSPGIDASALGAYLAQARGTLFGLYDMFVGGALRRATIFALGIMPYISASIIMQLLTPVVPYLERIQKEGEEGRKKITQYTRYGTVLLSLIQSYGISIFLEGLSASPGGTILPIVPNPGIPFRLLTMITLTSGTIFIMWLGEQISDRGIGNGISLIIFVGVLDSVPSDVLNTFNLVRVGMLGPIAMVFVAALMVAVTAAVVLMTQGQRRIPVQYAKRVIGRRMYGGQSTHIPLRINTAGVIPIIFAQSIMMFPGTISTFFSKSETAQAIAAWFDPGALLYSIVYAALIVFFTYFYTAIVFNPVDLADNMKKYGGFIPGIRPGARTAEYIDRVLTRITLPGAIFLAFVAILPFWLAKSVHVPFYFGGTALLIIVGVALDTVQQIESHLLMRHYEGFLRKGRIRGRR